MTHMQLKKLITFTHLEVVDWIHQQPAVHILLLWTQLIGLFHHLCHYWQNI